LLSKAGLLGSCGSQPLLCLHLGSAMLLCAGAVLPRWLLSPCTAQASASELCNHPWGSPPKTDDGVVSKEIAERFN